MIVRCLPVSLCAMYLAALLAAVPLGAGQPGTPVQRLNGEDDDEFTFATIADSHIRDIGGSDLRYIKALDKDEQLLTNYVRDINAHQPRVDFVVHLGDITDLGAPTEFDAARAIMDHLASPLYPVVGNHDNFRSDAKLGWKTFAGRDSTNYSFDHLGYHFIVIDCTMDPYVPPYVNCDSTTRAWVVRDLSANAGKPTIVFSHYNMWRRPWNAMFDTTLSYAEYPGMPELRSALEQAGNVVAVINGHVHANRWEIHNGIYYIDIGATLVGPPSIRYFRVGPDRIDVTFRYISDRALADCVTGLCPHCCCCFDPNAVCNFVNGRPSDKQFTIPVKTFTRLTAGPAPPAPATFEVALACEGRSVRATVSSDTVGTVQVSLADVLGRSLDHVRFLKAEGDLEVDLEKEMAGIRELPAGIYFLRFSLGGRAVNKKLALVP
jgi:predicted phosphodiesterase